MSYRRTAPRRIRVPLDLDRAGTISPLLKAQPGSDFYTYSPSSREDVFSETRIQLERINPLGTADLPSVKPYVAKPRSQNVVVVKNNGPLKKGTLATAPAHSFIRSQFLVQNWLEI